ncbi:MAG: curli assembly protein CsgG [Planctomycetaceae bacterium]|nr:curli assembly protein CsgG [Planctomycetaceae bacterium]
MSNRMRLFSTTALFLALVCCSARAGDEIYPLAVLPFSERGAEVAQQGQQVTDLMFANLVTNPELFLVDREDLDTVLKEQELSLSGAVKTEEAVQVGRLTGAKILVTGSVMQVGSSRYVIAKIIGTETSRVLGASVKGLVSDELDGLVEQLAEKVGTTIVEKAGELVAKELSREDRIAELKKKLADGKLPTLAISVPEQHVGQVIVDPAAETELSLYATETGFTVFDTGSGGTSKCDVRIVGEAFSEFAGRRGNLVSVKARVEVKAVDRASGKILVTDRQVTVAVDLSEQIAAKTALQEAGARLAERLLVKLAPGK